MEPKKAEDRVKRRLYSLYQAQITKLEKLAKLRKMPQSQYLRELIDNAYIESFGTIKKSVQYGAD